jgi:hypothetical protein
MFSFRVGVVLLFAVGGALICLPSEAEATPWGDFESIVQEYAKEQGAKVNHQVLWADPYGRNPHLKSNPQYKQYQAAANVLEVKYGEPMTSVERPAWTFCQWFHNSMSMPMKNKFSKLKIVEDKFTWDVDGNLVFAKDKTKKNFTFMIPPQLGLDRKNYSKEFKADEVMYGFHRENTVVKQDLFNISQEVTVPSDRSVEATLVITEKDVTIPWTAELEISGYFAVWFKKKWRDHWLWFFPVDTLSVMDPHFRTVGSKLRYTVKGTFTGVFSTAAHLHLKEHELKMKPFPKDMEH